MSRNRLFVQYDEEIITVLWLSVAQQSARHNPSNLVIICFYMYYILPVICSIDVAILKRTESVLKIDVALFYFCSCLPLLSKGQNHQTQECYL